MEVELKLLARPEDLARLRNHPVVRAHTDGKPRQQRLLSVYFDTPDLYFRDKEAALRVRKLGRRWMQTLKAGGQVQAGLHTRDEWESEVAGPRPDLAALAALVGEGSAWAEVLADPALAAQLTPVFATEFRRTVRDLALRDGSRVELALDLGEIRSGERREAISELELELQSGAPGALFGFALALLDAAPLRVGNASKAQRGYALYAPQPPAVVKAVPVELAPDLTVEQVFRAIGGACLAQVQGNEAGVMDGADPESVHQMRVGLRRLRAALGLFRTRAPCPQAILEDIKWLAGTLGEARDWEVFAGETLAALAGAGLTEAQLAELRDAAQARAQAARQAAAAALGCPRYARLLLALGGWLESGEWRSSPQGTEAIEAFASDALARRHETLLKRGKRLAGGTPGERHRARIAAKKARYCAEFFQSLYPAKRVRPYVKALAGLQDALGRLNDAAIGERLAQRLAEEHPELGEAAGFVRGWLAACSRRDAERLGKLWRAFKRTPVVAM